MKKNTLLFVILVCVGNRVYTMDAAATNSSDQKETPKEVVLEALTDEEVIVWEWFSTVSKTAQVYPTLSPDDRKVYEDGLKYQDNPDDVIRSRTHYLEAVLQRVESKPVPYSKERILNVLLKKTRIMHAPQMKTPEKATDASAYVFSKELTKQEQDAFRKPAFIADRTSTEQAVRKWAHAVALWQQKLGEITEQQVAEKAEELFKEKIARLEGAYSS